MALCLGIYCASFTFLANCDNLKNSSLLKQHTDYRRHKNEQLKHIFFTIFHIEINQANYCLGGNYYVHSKINRKHHFNDDSFEIKN